MCEDPDQARPGRHARRFRRFRTFRTAANGPMFVLPDERADPAAAVLDPDDINIEADDPAD